MPSSEPTRHEPHRSHRPRPACATTSPTFAPGDTLKVHVRVVEGNKERVQVFQGVVIRRQGSGVRETFTVRKVSYGVGVERTFPVHSPVIAQHRGRHPRRRAPGQALLPPRPRREGRQDQGEALLTALPVRPGRCGGRLAELPLLVARRARRRVRPQDVRRPGVLHPVGVDGAAAPRRRPGRRVRSWRTSSTIRAAATSSCSRRRQAHSVDRRQRLPGRDPPRGARRRRRAPAGGDELIKRVIGLPGETVEGRAGHGATSTATCSSSPTCRPASRPRTSRPTIGARWASVGDG